MTVSVTYDFLCRVSETIDLSNQGATDPTISHKLANTSGTLTSATGTPVTKVHDKQHQLTAGAETIDLTAIANSIGDNEDWTGLKVQMLLIVAAAANTAVITFADGSTNGYNIFGDATGHVAVPAGGVVMYYGNETLDDIAAGDKTIDAGSSDTDAIYDMIIVAG